VLESVLADRTGPDPELSLFALLVSSCASAFESRVAAAVVRSVAAFVTQGRTRVLQFSRKAVAS